MKSEVKSVKNDKNTEKIDFNIDKTIIDKINWLKRYDSPEKNTWPKYQCHQNISPNQEAYTEPINSTLNSNLPIFRRTSVKVASWFLDLISVTSFPGGNGRSDFGNFRRHAFRRVVVFENARTPHNAVTFRTRQGFDLETVQVFDELSVGKEGVGEGDEICAERRIIWREQETECLFLYSKLNIFLYIYI